MEYHQAFPLKEFQETQRLNPYWSSFTCFCEVITGKKGLHPRTLRRQFDKLIEKDDYAKRDRWEIIKFLLGLRKK